MDQIQEVAGYNPFQPHMEQIQEVMDEADQLKSQPDMAQIWEEMKNEAVRNSRYDNVDAQSNRSIANMLADPRADPKSAEFEHSFFTKAVRQFINNKGMEFSEMPIVFRNLNVVGNTLAHPTIHTVGSALTELFHPAIAAYRYLKGISDTVFPPKYVPKDIIAHISGVLKPGECVLVIGRPGSGCSSLLRTFSNHVRTFKEVRGEIRYSGFTSKEFHDKFRGEIVYAEEGDPHYPSLTVRQTLDFALNCKVMSPTIREKIIEVTLKLYGLVNCQNTCVGDATLRGVSGGEKKRVSLAEATVVGGSAGIFDGCTKGLDAASSLDFVKALRAFADFQNRTVVASCYQASDAMFDLFDKVIVLAEGQCCYFGPTRDAVAYFEQLGFVKHPRDTAAEYLTTCASSGRIPPRELFTNYAASQYGVENAREADAFLHPDVNDKARVEFIERLMARKQLWGSKGKQLNGLYSVSMATQARMLIRREIQIIRGNSAAVILGTIFNLLMAIIVGSVFYQLPVTSAGAFTRGGAIYFGLLFNSVSSFAEIPKLLDGRVILYKHLDMALYRPSTHFLAQSLYNFLFDSVKVMFFSLILYFMVGLQATAGHFLLFYLTIMITNLAFGFLIKIFGFLASKKDQAINSAAIVLSLMTMYAGYMIPVADMKPWFKWILYINPLGYGFQTLMINEFEGLQLQCMGTSLVPAGPWYNNSNYQTCTLPGSVHGSATTDGIAYLQASLQFDPSWKWYNLLVNLGLMLVFLALDCIVLETVQHGKAGLSIKLFKPPTVFSRSKKEKREAHHEAVAVEGSPEDLQALTTLLWTNISYFVPHPKEKGQKLQLLNNIYGYARPGTMTALMGSSGAGKTTLLDVIAKRKTIGTVEGDILIGAIAPGAEYLKLSGYCEQMDVHNSEATVREALKFAASLRQPASVSKAEKSAYVDKIIHLLEMENLADVLVGNVDYGIGLSMEERKRLTIGIELVAKPKILFLDEPTSGLDAQAATNIIKLLRTLAKEGYALVVTIHQPSAMLFSEFDRLLLLGRGGKTIYFGELGHDSQTLISYFTRNGAPPCGPTANPAEYILDCIGAGTAHNSNTIDWFSKWNESSERAKELEIISVIKQRAVDFSAHHTQDLERARQKLVSDIPSGGYTIGLVMRRMFKSYWRNPSYNVGRVTYQICVALIVGFTFYQCPATMSGAQNRIFALFQTSSLGVVVIKLVIPMFIEQRHYAIREQSQGAYSASAFGLAVTTAEIPFAVVAATAFFLIYYWSVGLNVHSENIGYFYAILIAFTLWAVSFGQLLGSAIPNYGIAAALIPIMTSILSLFCGVTISYNDMPLFYKNWLYFIDPYHYLIEGLMVNDLGGLPLTCDDRSMVEVQIPAGKTCEQYFSPYLHIAGAPGVLQEPEATGLCQYCPVKSGDNIFHAFGWSYDNRWRNLGLLLAFWIFNRILTAILIRRFKVKR
ncbi:ABC-2 type transporter-domain-containing protein [Chytriomyces sp. MP71]|nr:ABC-2 type transporter-domain-containing protein [Chytriomyces sp. MP71]